jgi:hypothetical protein
VFLFCDARLPAIEELKAGIEGKLELARVLLRSERGALLECGLDEGRKLISVMHGR